ncbi:ATP-binding protein [Tessaracoccus lacteus]|uniref:ATP-binding protein n=1 Tax=Tessaracoccus lacteus TaxID=3041766 RepID=A0ABY8PW28_9ACTN|nr:SbcC/MukB-like Walker B domain-containing protein [Tessaracoccus sp. T21]WGT46668.1 ATP-binding protein [Tessaracoccus sp. T21]
MTMLDTLFGLIPAASRGQQWVAEDLQLVNWGGYDGPHRVRFSPTATLLCGGSGSGKSTLMDAYIALMMPHTTPFNGASNGGVTGRPRGQEQRNILSYGRGKLDESRTAEGTKVRVLRGDGEDTWTAIAMTWGDHDGTRFTAVRAWYIPAGARLLDDTVRVRGTVEGPFDLRSLEPAAAHRLSDASVKAAGLDTVATDREFSARLHSVLGIGAAGAGTKAMSLLARIQAGQQITTVDDLYKRMVLEDPETLATADAVVAHFDELESTHTRMVTARQQVRALEPIREQRASIEQSAERMRLIDAVGSFDDPGSTATLWRAEQRLGLLRSVERELHGVKQAKDAVVREKEAAADAAEVAREGLAEVLRAAGGDKLEMAERELRELERRLSDVRATRARLDESLAVLGEDVTTSKQFAQLADRARAALADPAPKESARDAYAEAKSARKSAEAEVRALETERDHAQRATGNFPTHLSWAREQLALAAGLAVEDLPFVGELIEVRTEFEPWRDAFNLALGGFARTLLIDAAHLPRFRAAINAVRVSERLSFEGVHTGLPTTDRQDPRTLPGRLDYRTGPFTGWLQDRLEEQFNFVCVDSPDELSRHGRALTITGQLARGNRGAHGGQGRANLLGFSNDRRLADLARLIAEARGRLADSIDACGVAEGALDAVDARADALRKVCELSWGQVDVAAVEGEQEKWHSIVAQVTEGNPRIADLQHQLKAARRNVDALKEEIGRAKSSAETVEQRWGAVMEEVDEAQAVIDAAEDDERLVADDHAAYLAGQFEGEVDDEAGPPSVQLERFDVALASASQRLRRDHETAQQTLVQQRELLGRTLSNFLERWPNPNLLADPDTSVGDFERILDDLETSGLHELEREWRDSLLTLSGNDLTSLDSALGRALREIRDRIEPINAIMRDLPFYDDDHRLQITTRENQSEPRRKFRRDLRAVREAIDGAVSDADREQVYLRMSKLIQRIRRTAPDFADLIDVRNHVRVSAERVNAVTKEHVALYDHIGEKSGGESQELIAFIVGAALRYQLGDAGSSRPRYAPVFLDEALIKADAHFTKRAIGAWRGLGFQLIIGAPNDKYSAIEPHVDVEYDILKDTRGRSWAKPKVGLAAS